MILVVMGVSGCGKTTVAQALARRLGAPWLDADAYHPQANIDKMSRGFPLTDEDRAGWLALLAEQLRQRADRPEGVVLACSALKEAYREVLRVNAAVRFVYLKGTFELIENRMKARTDHFMKPGLLASQFQTLEEPACGPGTDAWAADISLDTEVLVEQALAYFTQQRQP